MPKIKAILTSDIHFSLGTLELAKASLEAALKYAQLSHVPLIIAGDLHDTKAIIRAECANAIIELMWKYQDVEKFVIIGNHDLINEKSADDSLHFLDALCEIIREPTYNLDMDLWMIPYFADMRRLEEFLKDDRTVRVCRTLIMHQGVMGAHMGEYVVDKTSLPKEAFAEYRVISGHYHRAQDIQCGRLRKDLVGLFSYIGTPYSVTFAEAQDGPKGIRILHDDGTLESFPLNLRKHVVEEVDLEGLDIYMHTAAHPNPEDLFWLKVHGPMSELDKLDKKKIGLKIIGHENFKLDKIPTEDVRQDVAEIENLSEDQMLDKLIEDSEETQERKELLKKVWREIL